MKCPVWLEQIKLGQVRNQIMVWTLLIAAGFALVAVLLAANITRPIQRLTAVFKDLGQGEGDLRYRIDTKGQDEMAQLSRGFNSFISKIHRSVKEVAETGIALRGSAESVSALAETTLYSSHEQRDRTLQVATAINQMRATVNEIAGNANLAAEVSLGANSETSSSQNVVSQARDTINQLEHNVDQVSDVIQSLENNSQAIGGILDVIRGISEQTNLLALNAAIEAARAGEQGRGFSVVADEVRNLASRTADSTDEIQRMINKLQEEAGNAVSSVSRSKILATEGVLATDKTSAALHSIADQIALITDMNTQVATATEEQSTVINTINQTIEEISENSQCGAYAADHLSQSSQDLTKLSQRLEKLVETFKL
ncbi:methyl-accepting chemotaxis protein [Vibrio sp. JC009]|uniref:methyl-accepting chemotaxis protein n=1 Tax=Vibrio sp. JC009 TaxID=2912314 RepID=UPI0023AEECE5|nr:methyl-accepting chemotaxis protein [Vibrio sp. JC009]WED21324.1 methyl-accepting chemotaxis protein [Vibrio sp. JC009]